MSDANTEILFHTDNIRDLLIIALRWLWCLDADPGSPHDLRMTRREHQVTQL